MNQALMTAKRKGLKVPYSVDFSTLADGPLPKWFKGLTWAISSGAAVCTPTEEEKVVNGDFAAWVDDNPEGWAVSLSGGGEDATNKVTEAAGGGACEIVRGTRLVSLYQAIGASKIFRIARQVPSFVSGRVYMTGGGASDMLGIYSSLTGISALLTDTAWLQSTSPNIRFYSDTNGTDLTIDNVSAVQLSGLYALASPTRPGITVKAGLTVPAINTFAGVIARADRQTNPQNFVVAYIHLADSQIRLGKVVNGAYTQVAYNGGLAYQAGGVLELRCSGTSYEVWHRNVKKISATTINEATINNNKIHGMFSSDGGNSLNSFFLHSPTIQRTLYIGGSITQGTYVDNWTTRTTNFLDLHYTSDEYNKGLSGTPSWYALIRLQTDVIANNPGLVAIDFAVNDAADAANGSRANGWKPAAEALIRRLRTALPACRLLVMNFNKPDNSLTDDYRASRDKWNALAGKYGLPLYKFYEFIQELLGTETPTAEQVAVYWDGVHPTQEGNNQIAVMLQESLLDYYPLGAGGWSGDLGDYDPSYYDDVADFEHEPIIRNGIDNDGETGTGWSTSGTSRQSSTAGDTICWTGTFCSFGWDSGYGGGNGVVAWQLDGGDFNNWNLGTQDVANRAIYNFERGVHTITLKVISGLVKINRFLAI